MSRSWSSRPEGVASPRSRGSARNRPKPFGRGSGRDFDWTGFARANNIGQVAARGTSWASYLTESNDICAAWAVHSSVWSDRLMRSRRRPRPGNGSAPNSMAPGRRSSSVACSVRNALFRPARHDNARRTCRRPGVQCRARTPSASGDCRVPHARACSMSTRAATGLRCSPVRSCPVVHRMPHLPRRRQGLIGRCKDPHCFCRKPTSGASLLRCSVRPMVSGLLTIATMAVSRCRRQLPRAGPCVTRIEAGTGSR